MHYNGFIRQFRLYSRRIGVGIRQNKMQLEALITLHGLAHGLSDSIEKVHVPAKEGGLVSYPDRLEDVIRPRIPALRTAAANMSAKKPHTGYWFNRNEPG